MKITMFVRLFFREERTLGNWRDTEIFAIMIGERNYSLTSMGKDRAVHPPMESEVEP